MMVVIRTIIESMKPVYVGGVGAACRVCAEVLVRGEWLVGGEWS